MLHIKEENFMKSLSARELSHTNLKSFKAILKKPGRLKLTLENKDLCMIQKSVKSKEAITKTISYKTFSRGSKVALEETLKEHKIVKVGAQQNSQEVCYLKYLEVPRETCS